MKPTNTTKSFKRSTTTLCFFLYLLLNFWNANAQGTTCATAESITINGACDAATISDSAQNTPNATGCSVGGFRREGWYTFTVTGGPLNVTITGNAADRDLFLQLISSTSSCTGLAQINCANTTIGNGAQTETITASLANGIYYVKVINNGSNGDMVLNSLCVTSPIPPSNDDCTGAIALTVNTSCTYTTYTNLSATASTTPSTPPVPGCSSYTGGDIWFSFVVPASGEVTIDSQTGGMTDGGMAWYTGACGSLTLLECDDDDSANGLMPTITRTGMTPGTTVYVRFWEYGNDNQGTFGICASTRPACTTPTTQPTTLNLTQPVNGTISGTFTAASPVPSNYLVVYNTTGTAPTPVNGTAYTVGGTVSAGNFVADIDTNTSFSVAGLNSSTTYYFFVFSFNNNSCSGGPLYLTTAPLTANATTPFFYCVPAPTSIDGTGITNVTMGTINNSTGAEAGNYGNYSAMITNGLQLQTINFSITFATGYAYGTIIWVDWNNDGDFIDAGEQVYTGLSASTNPTTLSGNFIIPAGASIGNHRVRIGATDNDAGPSSACYTGSYGAFEDYTLNVNSSGPCTTPTAQATALSLTPSGTSISGSFVAASPAPDSYLVVINTTGTTPSPNNTTTYTIGGTVGAGNTVVDTDGNTSFTATGLTVSTQYYVFVFAFNAACTGGPLYYLTTPLNGNTTTLAGAYCTANNSTNTTYYISGVTTTGGATNFSNTGTGFSAGGYANYTGTHAVSQNSGLSFNITATHPSSTYGYSVWADWNNDFDFNDAGENVLVTSYLSSPTAVGTVTIPAGTPAGNYRFRIRNAYLSNPAPACGDQAYGETEDYRITVLGPLPCAGNPSSVIVTVTSLTTTTVSWTAPAPAPASGYQYYLSTLNTAPNMGTTPTGTTGAGITTINLTGLTSGTTYYIWVRSNCGAPDGQGAWIGSYTFYQPNCVIGDSTGTTTLGCPSVLSGGLGLSGADPAPIACTSGSNCVDLEATYLPLGDTTDYTVEAIPYNPPYQFGCLLNPVSVNSDDVWSPVVNLPFNFCFYGNSYNSCLIGSNGILSFKTTSPGGATGYSFSNSLPSTTGALFVNSIYGVYHDIDPSAGGEVGWELITLNTGCRALVASWNNVPMFSDNTLLYTGMMVLYENTNVIEVYIKEKRVDGTWNGGNAIVGIQNITGTQAVVAPGRNGMDADWTVTPGPATSEAWRFVPSGTSITSIKWHEGSGTSGPVIGTTDIVNVCPASTTTYTAEVTYTLCNGTTLIETEEATVTVSGNKVWDGSVNTDWSVADNWTPSGVPTALDCVVIPNVTNNPIVSGVAYNGLAYSVIVQNGGLLTVNSNNSITVTNFVNVNTGGTFNIENSASLVQIDNVANTGNINMARTANMRKLDYVYWASPVANFASNAISPGTSAGYIYKWSPTIGSNTNGWGNWIGGNETMTIGKGYIVRGPDSFTNTLANYTANFTGVPNNGIITTPISRGTYDGIDYATTASTTLATKNDDNWNLVGNPYPSAINAISFLTANTNIDGFIKIWTHGTMPDTSTTDPFYNNYVYNYTPGDYITYNISGTSSGPGAFGGAITAGQGFFVLMNHTSVGTSENVTFTNSLRNSTYNNSQFFRDAAETDIIERNRIWLDLVSASGTSVRTLVGYISGATNSKDRLYDAITDTKINFNLYSVTDNEKVSIQGRALPFDNNDRVPMGVTVPQNGIYSFAIATTDGLFSDVSKNIYIEDLLTGIIHNLRDAPYNFTAQAGITENRFVLRYTDSALGNGEFNFDNTVHVVTNEKVSVYSSQVSIKDIIVYDVLGRKIDEYKNVGVSQFALKNLNRTTNALIMKITLENGIMITEKIIY